MSNVIVYFAYEGENNWSGDSSDRSGSSTKALAEQIQKAVGGPILQIERQNPYSLDFEQVMAEARQELDDGVRPAIVALPDLEDYDTVFIGFPIWFGTMPTPVFSFLDGEDLAGKKVAPFCTNEGSEIGRAEADLKALCPDSVVCRGLAVAGNDVAASGEKIDHWAHRVLER